MDQSTIGDWTKLGAVLRDARLEKALTQSDLASRAGVARSWLARVEAGHRGAELEPLLRLLGALDLALSVGPRDTEREDAPGRDRGEAARARREAWGMAVPQPSQLRPEAP